jgi:SAM-dependent methyltransferase
MPSLDWNTTQWGKTYGWSTAGEVWSDPWGGSEAQWYGSLLPRIHRYLPAPRILEIAPGFGRWTRYLLPFCIDYLGIDLNANCVEACSKRFSDAPRARFVVNDGVSLRAAEDRHYDFVFSFDSLVHADFDVFEAYIPEILKKLAPRGVAFIHHSNLGALPPVDIKYQHSRAISVSGRLLAELIARSGGTVLIQETVNWLNTVASDCFTMFGSSDSFRDHRSIFMENISFMVEAGGIAQYQAPYSTKMPPR